MSHQPKAFVPALPLGRDEQDVLVRFLAGRQPGPGGQAGAFAIVSALRPSADRKE